MESDAQSDITNPEEGSEQESEDASDESRKMIREKLSTMSFEDLKKLKSELGSKLYNEAVFGVKKTKTHFKRANKNRPREMSSKKRTKHCDLNPVVVVGPKQHVPRPRDPRFDPLCGSFDNEIFKSNYKFVNDIRKKEKTELEKELETTTNVEKKKKIKFVLQRLGNQIREEEKVGEQKRQAIEEKKHIKETLKKGEKPQFRKKSVKKLENLIAQYEELKKGNKLQKHIEKRSKKLKTKDRKNLEKQNLLG